MAKATLQLPDGTKVQIEGSVDEIKNILVLHGLKNDLSGRQEKPSLLKREPLRISASKKISGPRAWLGELIDGKFFSKPKTLKDILLELETQSHHLKGPDLTNSLKYFCHEKKLRRSPKEKGARLKWVNW